MPRSLPSHQHEWVIVRSSRDPDGSRRLHFRCYGADCLADDWSAPADSYLANLASRTVVTQEFAETTPLPEVWPPVLVHDPERIA